MHFTLSPFGSAGDVHPFLGLALELRSRGHEISFIVHGYFESIVRRYNLDYIELGTEQDFLQGAANPSLWHPVRAFPHIFNQFIVPTFRRHHEIVIDQHAKRKSVVVTSVLGMGARVAQESAGVPVVSVHLQPSVIYSDYSLPHVGGMFGPTWLRRWQFKFGEWLIIDRTARCELNRFRSEFGLAPFRHLMEWWHSPDLVVCLFPEWFAPRQQDWPTPLVHAGFPLWDDGDDASLSGELQSFIDSGSPPIAFTPGSANRFGRRFFEVAVEACRRLGRRGLLLSRFSDQIPSALPSECRHVSYAPYAKLLPQCAASVHHGGIGTMAQGLAAGVPQLITPLAHDQFDNAVHVKELEVGDWLNKRHLTARKMAHFLDRLTSSIAVEQACKVVSARLAPNAGLAHAADAIEAFARTRLASKR